jgi:recombination protein RecA
VWLEGAWKQDIDDAANKTIGQNAHFNVIASALGPPGAEVTVPIIYGRGVDERMDLFNVCCELGLIQKAGAWYSISGIKEKLQGQLAVVDVLRKNDELYKSLLLQVETMAMPCK